MFHIPSLPLNILPVVLCVAGGVTGICSAEPLAVRTDFAGGSARVLEIDQEARRIRIEPAAHPGMGWECWWYLQVSGVTPGETLELDVGKAPWATPTRASFSMDDRKWRLSEPGVRHQSRITYRIRVDTQRAWFAWGPPYVLRNARESLELAARKIPGSELFELCRSRGDRPVPALRTHGEGDQPYHVWIQARQHAWEAGSSWVCQGLIEWLASGDERAERLRREASLTVVPIMDVDNVELGAGGKNQLPHDHNRDWSDQPHWHAVAAAQRAIEMLDQAGRFDVFIDLHNPDAGALNPFFFVTPRKLLSARAARNLDHFLAAAQLEITGPLAFLGQVRESGENYDPQWRAISKNWVSLHTRDHVVSLTLETAWNTPSSSAEGYRTVGRQLGLALERYLRTNPRE